MQKYDHRPSDARLKTETDNQCEIQLRMLDLQTFPVTTELMIKFDPWRLREAIG